MKKIIGFLIIISQLISCQPAIAHDFTDEQAIKCIMGEARGEPYEGQVAVGEVLRRRGSKIGFYGYDASFTYSKKVYEKAKKAWEESKYSNYSKGATHFEGDDFKRPLWAKNMNMVAHIGHQQFFKEIR